MIRKFAHLNGGTDTLHETLIIREIMPCKEHWPQHFAGPKQMVEIGSAMSRTSRAIASRIEWRWIVGEAGIP
jgi:hypothetical protein